MMSVPKMIAHNIRIDLCPEKTKNCPRRNRNSGRNLSFFNLRNPVSNKVFANKKYTGKKEKNLLNQMTTKRGKNQRNHFRALNSTKNIRKLSCLIAWKKEIQPRKFKIRFSHVSKRRNLMCPSKICKINTIQDQSRSHGIDFRKKVKKIQHKRNLQ